MPGKYTTERQRYEIEAYLKAGLKPKEIAALIGKCEKTIYNEIHRGSCSQLTSDLEEKTVYLADVSQRKYEEKKQNKGAPLKIGKDLRFCKEIFYLIKEQRYSPYAALQLLKKEKSGIRTEVCTQTLYSYIKKGLILDITARDLPMVPKRKKKTNTKRIALKNLKGTSIEERPKEIRERKEYGHWEMDTVIGGRSKNGKACLLVLSERMTRDEIILKIRDKKTASVCRALDAMERRMGSRKFREKFKTITCDNGVEFLDHEGIEKSIHTKRKRTRVYYCHPYAPGERGTNENTNRLIRRFIPKGAVMEDYSKEDINLIEEWINNYPRRILGGLSAKEYKKELGIA